VRTQSKWPLVAVFAVITGALGFGASFGFPILGDAWVPLIVRERGVAALAADSADRPVFGAMLQAAVSLFGFGPAQSAVLAILAWLTFAWQIARLWRRVFPERSAPSWLPAMLALSPIVVRTQFTSLVTILPCQLPVMIGLEALLLGLRDPDETARRRLVGSFLLAAAAASISEYGVAGGIASGLLALVLFRPALSAVLVSGTVIGSVIFRLSADASVRPDVSTGHAFAGLAAHPFRPVARVFSGLWYALFGAYGEAAGRVDFDTLSRSSLVAAGLGVLVAVLAVRAVKGREIAAPRAPRATLALLLATAAGIVPVVLADRAASLAGGGLDPVASRFLLPILPFSVCLTAGMLATLANAKGFLAGTFLLSFLCAQAGWREAFDAGRAQRRMVALGAALRPLAGEAPASGITLAVVPDEPWLAFPPVVTGRATVGWPADEARRVWIMPRALAVPLIGGRTDCPLPDELRIPRDRHSVERVGPLARVVWVSRLSPDVVELERYCVARGD
jgi:hypothetical protein